LHFKYRIVLLGEVGNKIVFIKDFIMIPQSIDTDLKTERVLISLIRNATPAKKLSQVRSLSQTMIQLSKRAIARANKEIDEQEVNLGFVAHHYGKDLAERLRKYLDQRKAEYEKS
jgi:hypothetical protein